MTSITKYLPLMKDAFYAGRAGSESKFLWESFEEYAKQKSVTRIIFVGVHNKPEMEPLDSRSKSGKMIDRVISALQTEVGLFDADFIKTNLFDSLQIPPLEKRDGEEARKWANRVGHKDDDIIICLGAIVHSYFKRSGIKFIKIGHPSGVWSKVKQEEYLINTCIKVSEKLLR